MANHTPEEIKAARPALPRPAGQGPCASNRLGDPLPSGRGKILFVEDEPTVLGLMQEVLERMGYEVLAEDNGEDAFRSFLARPETFDLVITDRKMPGMTGDDLCRKLRAVRHVPVIMYTSDMNCLDPETSRGLGILEVVAKPAPLREFASAVQRAMARV
jgi:CheY-like chemotaxis protein